MKVMLLGDVCPTQNVKEIFREKNTDALFTDVAGIMRSKDFIAVNLECALTETDEKINKFGPNLKAPKETAEVLKSLGVKLCGLSNNHVFDFGTVGALDPEYGERWYAYFGHMLDCEAHTDVWRELFPSWNLTNCTDNQ